MIKNNICENCNHLLICKINDKLAVFSENAKKDLGVTITINECKEYSDIN